MKMGSKANRIIVAIDASPISETVMREAAEIARSLSSDVYVISVIPVPSLVMSESDVDSKEIRSQDDSYAVLHNSLITKYFSDTKLLVESKVLHGDPVKKICEFAESMNARLIVLGSRGMGHLQAFLLGSTSEGVLRNAKTSVMVVK
jgi:nucleotide-binding universal stress UspA family protein